MVVPLVQIHEPDIFNIFRFGGFSFHQQSWNAFRSRAEIFDTCLHLANPCEGF